MLRIQPCQERCSVALELSSLIVLPVSFSAFSVNFFLVSFTLTSRGDSWSAMQDEWHSDCPNHCIHYGFSRQKRKNRPELGRATLTHHGLAEDGKVASACSLKNQHWEIWYEATRQHVQEKQKEVFFSHNAQVNSGPSVQEYCRSLTATGMQKAIWNSRRKLHVIYNGPNSASWIIWATVGWESIPGKTAQCICPLASPSSKAWLGGRWATRTLAPTL